MRRLLRLSACQLQHTGQLSSASGRALQGVLTEAWLQALSSKQGSWAWGLSQQFMGQGTLGLPQNCSFCSSQTSSALPNQDLLEQAQQPLREPREVQQQQQHGQQQHGQGQQAQEQQQEAARRKRQQQQYMTSTERLNAAVKAKDLALMAQMFNPAAMKRAPDRGAGLFEALLHAAARVGDLVLVRALVAAMTAAGAPMSAAAHRAVLHALGKAGRHDEALDRLLHVVPRHLLSSHHVLAVVRPAAAAGAVREVEQALKLAQQCGLPDADQLLARARIYSAGCTGDHAAIQRELAAVQQELAAAAAAAASGRALPSSSAAAAAAAIAPAAPPPSLAAGSTSQEQQQGPGQPSQHPQQQQAGGLLIQQQRQQQLALQAQRQWQQRRQQQKQEEKNVFLLATYVGSLHKAARHSPSQVVPDMQAAMEQLVRAYRATLLTRWAHDCQQQQQHALQAGLQQQQQQQQQLSPLFSEHRARQGVVDSNGWSRAAANTRPSSSSGRSDSSSRRNTYGSWQLKRQQQQQQAVPLQAVGFCSSTGASSSSSNSNAVSSSSSRFVSSLASSAASSSSAAGSGMGLSVAAAMALAGLGPSAPAARQAAAPGEQQQQLQLPQPAVAVADPWQAVADSLDNWQVMLPASVTVKALPSERDVVSRAFDQAMHTAATCLDGPWMRQLLAGRKACGLPATQVMVDSLMHLGVWQGDTPEALEGILAEALAFGVRPNHHIYEHLAEAYALHGQPAAALEVLQRMAGAGLQPNGRTYKRLIHGLGSWGALEAAGQAYQAMVSQGVQPTTDIMARLFRAVRLHAMRLRVDYARRLARVPPGDNRARAALRSERAAHLAAAYGQLVAWQRDMAALGCTHSDASLHHLLQALDRLNCLSDALQLAELFERLRPGASGAAAAALKASLRQAGARSAGQADQLAGRLHERGQLTKADYVALLFKQFWLDGDHGKLLETLGALRAEGYASDPGLGQLLLQQLAAAGLWGQVLELLDELAAAAGAGGGGRAGAAAGSVLGGSRPANSSSIDSSSSSSRRRKSRAPALGAAAAGGSTGSKRHGGGFDASGLDSAQRAQLGEAVAHEGVWRSRTHAAPQPVRQRTLAGFGLASDGLWHIIFRSLIGQGHAADEVVGALVERMSKGQLVRFRQIYPSLRQRSDGTWTVQPPGSWEVVAGGGGGSEQGSEGQGDGGVEGSGGGEEEVAGLGEQQGLAGAAVAGEGLRAPSNSARN